VIGTPSVAWLLKQLVPLMRAESLEITELLNYLLTLAVLETCVKNCGHRFHVHVASRDFIDGVLVKIISPKTNPPTIRDASANLNVEAHRESP
ncbi:hypothetical protein CRUP_028905, partial [Coryphaenoides rupestris]